MVLNNLSKFVEHYRKQLSSIEGTTFNIRGFEGLPFYCDWPNSEDEEKASPIRPVIGNTDCCFNHAIGLPTKYVSEVGEDTPLRLFDYEKMLYQRLYQYKHLWIKKATGLGVTEFMLRYMAISMPLPLPNVGSGSKEVAEKEKQSLRRANVYIIKGPGPNYFFKFQKKKTYKYLSVGESSPNPFRLEMGNNDPKYIKSYRSYVD